MTAQPPYTQGCSPDISNYPEYESDGFVSVDVEFNDYDGDCISNDFTITFTNDLGYTETWTNNQGDNGDPIDFGGQGCCAPGTGDSGGSEENCDCEMIVSSGVIIIDCDCNPE